MSYSYDRAIRRWALIVGAPGAPPLPGVPVDLRRYRDFLLSDHGGAWEDDEVTVYESPSRADVQTAIRVYRDIDFSLVVFSGHGHCDDEGETNVWVNDDEYCSVSELNTYAKRQVIIVDACRKQIRDELFEKRATFEGEIGGLPDFRYRASCRRLYDEAIANADAGQSIAYSCSPGEAAGDTSRGGRFSRALLDTSERWGEGSWHGARATVIRDLPSAVGVVQEMFVRNRYPQTPQLENGRRWRSFPFAVA